MIDPRHILYLDRMRSQIEDTMDLSRVPDWLCHNTAHPIIENAYWNFKEHEYQIGILSDMSDEVCVRKCSQVGASEMWVRLVLAVLVLVKKINIIYVLPTKSFASEFSKSRVDPVIDASRAMRAVLKRGTDSSALKQLGNSFLHIKGSYGQDSAISVPAKGLFQDEVDFCNPVALSTFNSRLGHAKPGEYFKRSFSTPTVPGFGIDAMYETSSQAFYSVYCRGCQDQVGFNYMEDVVIPGFDGNLLTFEKEDLENSDYKIDEAFVRCRSCGTSLEYEDFCNPEKRSWIHTYQDRPEKGYQILPMDVPTINPIPRTIRQISEYDRKKDWVNFKVGYPFVDSETSFLTETIRNLISSNSHFQPENGDTKTYMNNTVFGLDVGKVCWFVVLKEINYQATCIYAERIRQDGDNYVGQRVNQLIRNFGCSAGVVDAGPDISIPGFLINSNNSGKVWACEYTRSPGRAIKNVTLLEDEQVVKAYRTGCISDLAKKFNSGNMVLTKSKETAAMLSHLDALKKVDRTNNLGEKVSHWHSTGDDHYGHALNYANIAYNVLAEMTKEDKAVSALPLPRGIRLRASKEEAEMHRKLTDPLRFGARL